MTVSVAMTGGLIMVTPIEDHTTRLGIKGVTLERLKAINIHTLEDLAESSIDIIRRKLNCTKERAMVLINKANRALHHMGKEGHKTSQISDPSVED
jgi:hypothetical protein